jgi:DNA polymerase-4
VRVSLIAHLDADAFYVSVELLRRPDLRGKPVVVAGTGPRAVVTTASYEARRFGVFSATPASRARRLCPDAVFLPPDFDTYRATSKRVMDLLRSHVERVEVVGLDEAYLDLDGLLSPKAAMRRLLTDVHEQTGLTCSVGIGPNTLVAKVASDAEKPRGFVVLTREQACERFAGERPGLIPGIGPKTAEKLQRLGIVTLGALAGAPDELLSQQFGANHGPDLRRLARFEGAPRLTTHRVAVSESRERTFDYDVADPQELERVLDRLTEKLCTGLAKSDRRGRTIAIKIRLDDFSTFTRARTIAEATNDVATVGSVARGLLREFGATRPVRLLGVRVASFDHGEAPEAAGAVAAQLRMTV